VRLVGALVALGASVAAAQADPLAARSKGDPQAPVTVYEMGDFQCPACRQFALSTFPLVEREYITTGKVRWVFVHYPLTSIHANAAPAAQAATCAAQQGKFWPMHDLLYARQAEWADLDDPTIYLLALAEEAGVHRPTFVACARSDAARREVEADAARSLRAGARSTPSFYIEGGLVRGAAPIATFRHVLDSIYRSKRPPGSR
jgi:protein-disulfide isomerase